MEGIWGSDIFLGDQVYNERRIFKSVRCGGQYTISRSAMVSLEHMTRDERMLLSEAVWRSQTGAEPVFVNTEFLQRAKSISPPSISERMERGIEQLVRLCPMLGVRYSAGTPSDVSRTVQEGLYGATFSDTPEALLEFLREYEKQGFISRLEDGGGFIGRFRLSLKAHQAGDRAEAVSQRAFVAMWFSHAMISVFDEGIEPAIRDSGYRAIRIDHKEHNNKIDDEIIAEIRRSKFLVADFTSEPERPRGGVYYEAGFAQGIGLPVVWTCREDLIGQVHFDTRQFNHIVWKDPEHLRTMLTNRIRATIGQGPLTHSEEYD